MCVVYIAQYAFNVEHLVFYKLLAMLHITHYVITCCMVLHLRLVVKVGAIRTNEWCFTHFMTKTLVKITGFQGKPERRYYRVTGGGGSCGPGPYIPNNIFT